MWPCPKYSTNLHWSEKLMLTDAVLPRGWTMTLPSADVSQNMTQTFHCESDIMKKCVTLPGVMFRQSLSSSGVQELSAESL